MGALRLPLATSLESRDGTLRRDGRLKNALLEQIDGEAWVVKRPGVATLVERPPGLAQGLFSLNGIPYAVVNDSLVLCDSSGGGSGGGGSGFDETWVLVNSSISPQYEIGSVYMNRSSLTVYGGYAYLHYGQSADMNTMIARSDDMKHWSVICDLGQDWSSGFVKFTYQGLLHLVSRAGTEYLVSTDGASWTWRELYGISGLDMVCTVEFDGKLWFLANGTNILWLVENLQTDDPTYVPFNQGFTIHRIFVWDGWLYAVSKSGEHLARTQNGSAWETLTIDYGYWSTTSYPVEFVLVGDKLHAYRTLPGGTVLDIVLVSSGGSRYWDFDNSFTFQDGDVLISDSPSCVFQNDPYLGLLHKTTSTSAIYIYKAVKTKTAIPL